MSIKEKWTGRTYHPVHRQWPRTPRRGTAWLMLVELIGLIPILVIFGIAQPDLYRTDMWKIGYDNKLNSNPNMVLYAYANHRALPDVPLVWSRTFTDFNVAISVISLFFLLTKLITFIMKGWFPIIALVINVGMVGLYTVSVYGQIGPDYADDRYPSWAVWYLRYGCDMARPYGAYSSCQIAQSSLGVTCYMLVVYIVNLAFAAWAMWPNKELNDAKDDDDDNDSLNETGGGGVATMTAASNPWEMQDMKSPTTSVRNVSTTPGPFTPGPFTPRTQAFHTLDRQLPLRQNRYG